MARFAVWLPRGGRTAAWWAWLLVAAAVGWNLVSLRALTIRVPYLNDSSVHEHMVRFATSQLRSGHLPLTSWFPFLGEGSPQFLHYQSLPAILTGAAGLAVGPDVAFRWSLYLLWSLWPISVYLPARAFGAGRPAAAASAGEGPTGVVGVSRESLPTPPPARYAYGFGTGVAGIGDAIGVQGTSDQVGVLGAVLDPHYGTAVHGEAVEGYGVSGLGGDIGVFAQNLTHSSNVAYLATRSLAADFQGDVWVSGHLHKAKGGFVIDHPSDPSNRYLAHSFVESDEMKNIYDGVVICDDQGAPTVGLPRWFEVINERFRYQLTAVGAPAPDLHVARELSGGAFEIAGGKEGLRVCWQVTGVRKDPIARADPLRVEQDKPPEERGYFLHPELYGKPGGQSIAHARYERGRERDLSSLVRKPPPATGETPTEDPLDQ